jgi:outer membrane protein
VRLDPDPVSGGWLLKRALALLLVGSIALASDATAQDFDLALGYGVSAVGVSHYPGSDQHRSAVLPFPYVHLRSRFLDVERDRVRGKLWASGPWALDISLGGSLPVDSDENIARQGMADLDWMLEAGPSLKYRPFEQRRPMSLRFELPVRAAHSMGGGKLEQQGWLAIPQLQVDWRGRRGSFDLGFEASAGVQFGSARYHRYYYGVDAADVTPDRPAYAAEQGRGVTRLLFAVTARRGPLWLGAFLRRTELGEATFSDSPLVRVQSNTDVGVALAWILDVKSQRG